MKTREEKQQIKIVYEEVEIVELKFEKEVKIDNHQQKNRFSVKEEKYVN